jgi:hypothetical protein
VTDIKEVAINNFSGLSEDLAYQFGALPVRMRVPNSDNPVFFVSIQEAVPRIARSAASSDRPDKRLGPKEVDLTDAALFLLSDAASAKKIADLLHKVAASCANDSITIKDDTDHKSERSGPPGQKFQEFMQIVSPGGTQTAEREYEIPVGRSQPPKKSHVQKQRLQ